jgi:hypothetical protein
MLVVRDAMYMKIAPKPARGNEYRRNAYRKTALQVDTSADSFCLAKSTSGNMKKQKLKPFEQFETKMAHRVG